MDTKTKDTAQNNLQKLLELCDIEDTIENRFLTKSQITGIIDHIKQLEYRTFLAEQEVRKQDNYVVTLEVTVKETVKSLIAEGIIKDAR